VESGERSHRAGLDKKEKRYKKGGARALEHLSGRPDGSTDRRIDGSTDRRIDGSTDLTVVSICLSITM
jgi:hypothetical protein